MQREIRKKMLTYGITAVFLALLLTTVVYNVGIPPYIRPVFLGLKTFQSYEELESFLNTNMEQAKNFKATSVVPFFSDAQIRTLNPLIEGALSHSINGVPHSTTNVQVAGVDEADIVKTDGEYLYVVSGSNVYILKAYSPDQAKVLSKITLNQTYETNIYINGDKLVILEKRSVWRPLYTTYLTYDMYTGQTLAYVYNISNRSSPVLKRTMSLNGTLLGSRMIGDYVYVVTNEAATTPDNEATPQIALPKIIVNNVVKEVQPTEIRYIDVPDVFYYFTMVTTVNVMNDLQEPTYESLLTGASAMMYVSQGNMYMTVPDTSAWVEDADGAQEHTLVCRAKLDEEQVTFEAQGSVEGYALNQFSMDEYNGFFRIATTSGWGTNSVNSLYVMDMDLKVVGKISGIAPTERIYSARFAGDRCYLVTFRQIDPFFVIDLSNPTKPKILGHLEIPGFSGYLHPYAENHIIGVGKQDSNLKLSLFDVTNVTAPIEMAKFIVNASWSDSAVLTDHKAFLFNKTMELLVLPVSINNYWQGSYYWQGAYVFDLTLNEGFVLRGGITHHENSPDWWNSEYDVKRTLYIEDMLYTVSGKKVKINSLQALTPVKEIVLD